MFGTGTRFAEYGITGGFFIVTQILLLGWFFPDAVMHAAATSGAFLDQLKIPASIYPAVQSLLVALALLSVFIIGLLLDLAGSYFVIWEARAFRDHLVKNQHWVSPLIEAELPDHTETYATFLQLTERLGWRWQLIARSFALWKMSGWQEQKASLDQMLAMRRIQKSFRRLEFAFVACIVASGTKTELLAEQISICRMSRAITAAFIAVTLEIFALAMKNAFFSPSTDLSLYVLLALLAMASQLIPIAISLGAYSRFCLILFSLLYASSPIRKVHAAASGEALAASLRTSAIT